MNEILTALLMGLTGSAHCLTMCGSLSVALGFSIPKHKSFWLYALFVSFGRVFGYGVIGLTANVIAQSILVASNGHILYLSILSGVLMIGIGLHISGLSSVIVRIEVIGRFIDKALTPIKQKIMPIDSLGKCLLYGLLWGFLPCGLVYTALSLALVSPTPGAAFGVMVVFGFTTIPAVVGMTIFSRQLTKIFNNQIIKLLLGAIISCVGLFQIYVSSNKLLSLM